jgi:hypothetical protein
MLAWRERYALMGRQEKVAMIDAALQESRRLTSRYRFFAKGLKPSFGDLCVFALFWLSFRP